MIPITHVIFLKKKQGNDEFERNYHTQGNLNEPFYSDFSNRRSTFLYILMSNSLWGQPGALNSVRTMRQMKYKVREKRLTLTFTAGPFQGILRDQERQEWSHSHSLPHRETIYTICESPVFKHLVLHESLLLCTYLTSYV